MERDEERGPFTGLVCGGRVVLLMLGFTLAEWLARWLGELELNPRLLLRKVPMALALAAPVFLLGRAGRWYARALVLLAGGLCLLQVEMMLLFKSTFRREIFDILFATNLPEVVEFIRAVADLRSVGTLVVGATLLGLAVWAVGPVPTAFHLRGALIGAALLVPLSLHAYALLLVKRQPVEEILMRSSVTQLIHDYGEFNAAQRRFTQAVFRPTIPPRITRADWSLDPRFVGVVIIGESTARHHMGLYGYPRDTTPRLSRRAHELVAFRDAISAFATTGDAVRAALTLGVDDDVSGVTCTVPNVAGRSGYRVEVLTNSEVIGFHNAGINLMFKDADRGFLTWREFPGEYPSLDGRLVDAFARPLAAASKPTLFFVHLLGAHTIYRNRYPPEFGRFDGIRDGRNAHVAEDKARTINEYDNAILYTDFVVSRFVEQLEGSGRPGFVLFFSDHGEAVYEDGESFMHAAHVVNRYMYEIPLIVWFSAPLRGRIPALVESMRRNAGTPVQGDALSFGVLQLLGISFDGFPAARSPFAREYVPRRRTIAGQDYDARFPGSAAKLP